MKQYKVLMAEPGANDLQSIIKYIADELFDPIAAKQLIGKIKEAITGLSKMPARHAPVADERLAAQGVRKLIVGKYIVFYVTIEKDRIVMIIRILHDRRDWEHLI